MYLCRPMYVCMYVCIHVCMHVCMHTCRHLCMYLCVRMNVCMHVYMHTYIYVHVWAICVYMYGPWLLQVALQLRLILSTCQIEILVAHNFTCCLYTGLHYMRWFTWRKECKKQTTKFNMVIRKIHWHTFDRSLLLPSNACRAVCFLFIWMHIDSASSALRIIFSHLMLGRIHIGLSFESSFLCPVSYYRANWYRLANMHASIGYIHSNTCA